ncbi:MAG: sulfatase-like hydrolase/transferase, partial [Fuerstia sp.]|nr:sulfatase-like hydrolase/transferase [Fuerstiella sp.]
MNFRFIYTLCIVVLACARNMSASAVDDAVKPKPNFVFILADDLGYGELECYGQKVIQTPRLDLMAKQG